MSKQVDIFVINWNSGNLTLKALSTYLNYHSEIINCNVIVVDNASDDDSISLLKDKNLTLISNTENLGFGKACNQAFSKSKADYILLLNPDTESHVTTLEALVMFLEQNSEYAVVGPRQIAPDGTVIKTCGRFPSFRTSLFAVLGLSKIFPSLFTPAPIMIDWDHSHSKDVDHLMGSYLVIRRSAIDVSHFMDSRYFVYFEDLDLSKRIVDSGYKIHYNNEHSILHQCGGTGREAKIERLFYSLSSRRIYWKKHFGVVSYVVLISLSFAIEPFLRFLNLGIKDRRNSIKLIKMAYKLYKYEIIYK